MCMENAGTILEQKKTRTIKYSRINRRVLAGVTGINQESRTIGVGEVLFIQSASVSTMLNILAALFQDGFLICTLKDSIGCEACIAREEGKKINDYACEFMTDTGCERMFTAKSLILQSIMEGNDMEPCREQCCMGCKAICGFRCGQAT